MGAKNILEISIYGFVCGNFTPFGFAQGFL